MKYKVIALSVHSDKLQKVLSAGEVVNADAFHEGHADKLVADGFLAPVDEAAEKMQGPLKPFDGTNDVPVEDPQNPLSQDKPVDTGIKPQVPAKKK